MNLAPGMRIGNYEILGMLGSGGMGQVFRARDVQLGRLAAIKFLSDVGIGSEGGLRRFIAEAKAASALNHPNILTVYGIGEHEGNPYIAMEYVDGSTLRSIIKEGPLSLSRALEITTQTLAGLSKAHSIGIVHRDLKPENIMVTHDGFVKILDFGLAKLMKNDAAPDQTSGPLDTIQHSVTKTGMIVGTAGYMSPEQARGQSADLRSDIFSLGIVLYEMLTGNNPFRRETPVDTISAILRDAPPPINTSGNNLSQEFNNLLNKALQKRPEDRFASAREMETELLKVRSQMNTMERSDTIAYSTVLPPTTKSQVADVTVNQMPNKMRWGVTALILIALIGGALFLFREKEKPIHMGPPVIAVMAFENKTADPELAKADIGRVLSDAFVQVLYDCEGVQVISPWRVDGAAMELGRSYSDTSTDTGLIKKITKNLNANVILSGSLSQLGETFILNATLTDLISGKLIGNYRSDCTGKNEILSKLTSDISGKLKSSLVDAGVQMTGGRESKEVATGSLEAYAHTLRAKDFTNEGKWNEAVTELENALEIDPNMGLAWAELACAYSFAGDDARSKAAHTKAMELKPRLTRKEQEWLEGISAWLSGNGNEFRGSMEQFIKDFPDERDAHFYIGLSWQWLDHNCAKAIESYEIAYRLTPNYYPLTKSIVDCQLELKQKDKAVESLNRYLKLVRSGYGHQQAKGRLEKLL
ncbi:MAG TPA: serine/threonine-protein kinase [Acidobacteriota bacterium]|nr:serine/threonine-protein kinase [Acidobacteriota bacterium]